MVVHINCYNIEYRLVTKKKKITPKAIPSGRVVKNQPANAADTRNAGSVLGWGTPAGGGNGNPRQYPCLRNPMDRGAWRAAVHRVAQSRA